MSDPGSYETLDLSMSDGVATVLLNRPQSRNAISRRMRTELLDAFTSLAEDNGVSVVVVAGRGRAFCAGADLGEPDPPPTERLLMDGYLPVFQRILAMDKPVISAVSGIAAGIGMSLALACDLTIMAEDASFWAPFTRIGLIPDGGLTWLLTRQLGYRGAYAVAIQADRIPARRALELGLAHRIVPADELLARATGWAHELAAGSPQVQRHLKRLTQLAAHSDFETVFAAEARAQAECGESEFFLRARAEFLKS